MQTQRKIQNLGQTTFKYTGSGISKDVYTYCKTIVDENLENLFDKEIENGIPGELDELEVTYTFVNNENIYCQNNVKGNTSKGTILSC